MWTEKKVRHFSSLALLLCTPIFQDTSQAGIYAIPTDQIVAFVKSIPDLEADSKVNKWRWLNKIPLYSDRFPTYHPQGMKIIDNQMYISTVDPKADGSGYLIRYKLERNALSSITSVLPIDILKFQRDENEDLNFNHAGGIDYDGKFLWIPLAVYSPKQPTKIFKIEAGKSFNYQPLPLRKFPDHLGTTIVDTDAELIHFFNWTSGTYTIPLTQVNGAWTMKKTENSYSEKEGAPGWEYQDCKSIGKQYALCSATKGSVLIDGQIQLLKFDEENGQMIVLKSIAVPRINPSGDIGGALSLERPLTYNAMDFSFTLDETGMIESMRFYFVPHDDKDSTLFVLEVKGAANHALEVTQSSHSSDQVLKLRLPIQAAKAKLY